LPDDLFAHDGQITKREIRAATLSALAPRRGETLWDIGAGSGSVGIEWMLADAANRAVAIEAEPARAARIAANSAGLGVPDLVVVTGRAPAALEGLPRPDAIFVGGGGSDPAVLDAAWSALGPGGRIVVAAVTLEAQAEVIRRCRAMGGDLTQIAVSRAEPVGNFLAWRPALPVVHWRAVKP
jgi:precorrin-6Y C5,15-methyltransferase (decarboxylating)